MVRKLIMTGNVYGASHRKVSSYDSWPKGATHRVVQKLIDNYKKAFDRVTVRIEYMLDDDNYPY